MPGYRYIVPGYRYIVPSVHLKVQGEVVKYRGGDLGESGWQRFFLVVSFENMIGRTRNLVSLLNFTLDAGVFYPKVL